MLYRVWKNGKPTNTGGLTLAECQALEDRNPGQFEFYEEAAVRPTVVRKRSRSRSPPRPTRARSRTPPVRYTRQKSPQTAARHKRRLARWEHDAQPPDDYLDGPDSDF